MSEIIEGTFIAYDNEVQLVDAFAPVILMARRVDYTPPNRANARPIQRRRTSRNSVLVLVTLAWRAKHSGTATISMTCGSARKIISQSIIVRPSLMWP